MDASCTRASTQPTSCRRGETRGESIVIIAPENGTLEPLGNLDDLFWTEHLLVVDVRGRRSWIMMPSIEQEGCSRARGTEVGERSLSFGGSADRGRRRQWKLRWSGAAGSERGWAERRAERGQRSRRRRSPVRREDDQLLSDLHESPCTYLRFPAPSSIFFPFSPCASRFGGALTIINLLINPP